MGLSAIFGLMAEMQSSCCEIALVEHVVVLGDHVGIPGLLQAITCQGKRQYVRGVSCVITAHVPRQ